MLFYDLSGDKKNRDRSSGEIVYTAIIKHRSSGENVPSNMVYMESLRSAMQGTMYSW